MNGRSDLFLRSAAVLVGERPPADAEADAHELLDALGYGGTPPDAGAAALLRAAARLKRVFRLDAPDAPGLVFLGGEADPAILGPAGAGQPVASLSGTGLSLGQAFQSCVGEGIEYLSQFAAEGDVVGRAPADAPVPGLDPTARNFVASLVEHDGGAPGRDLDWVAATRLGDGAAAWLPADLCIRRARERRDFSPPHRLGTGAGAGVSQDAAMLHGLLELVERDAAGLWWRGGRRACAIPLEHGASREAAQLIARLRRGERRRASWLLDITTDLGVPSIAALSCGPDGYGLACGLAARPTLEEAASAAIFEMCQMELGYAVIEAKRREAGDGALNDDDRRHLRRGGAIDAHRCRLLHPVRSRTASDDLAAGSPAETVRRILDRLQSLGIAVFAVDITRATFGVPAVRVVAPALQLEPMGLATERLDRTIAETGGASAYTGAIPLI